MRPEWNRWTQNPMSSILIRKLYEDRQTHRSCDVRGHVILEASVRVMQLQTKKHQELLKATRSWEGFLSRVSRGARPY